MLNSKGETYIPMAQNKEITKEIMSYKDKLLGFKGSLSLDTDGLVQIEKDDQMEEDEDIEETLIEANLKDDPTCLIIPITKEEQLELCKPWRLALIVKLLGKQMSMCFLYARL